MGKRGWCIAELGEEYIVRVEDVFALYEKPLSEEEPVICEDGKPVCCTPKFARRDPCGRDGSYGATANMCPAVRPTPSVAFRTRRGVALPD
jgi:hypothetical protein